MCNPNTNTSEKSAPPQPHLYLSVVSLSEPGDVKPGTSPKGSQFQYPCISEIVAESRSLFHLSFPIAMTALLLYSRSVVSMLFLGSLGELELAAGSLAIAFANITGYSVLSGLALGMEPLCSQAFGARRPKLLALTLHRAVLFLLSSSVPISLLWVHMSKILIFLRQDPKITFLAQKYLLFCLPDLVSGSFVHPMRIYLRAQGITHPLTLASGAGALINVPVNLLLVNHLRLGVAGVAAASAVSNFAVVLFLMAYVYATGIHVPTWTPPTVECLQGWGPLVKLAAPSCISVCLEWWWYEIIIILCGLLPDPQASVASVGILIQTTALVYVFPSSLGFAVSTRVGNELGADRPDKARVSAGVAVSAAAIMGILATGFATGMKDRWGRFFTCDAEILRLTSAALPIVGLCELGNCPQTVSCGVLRGSARPGAAANVNLGAFYLVGMPCAVGLAFWLGVGFCGLWLGLLAAQVCCAGLMLYVLGTTDWNSQADRALVLTSAGGGSGVLEKHGHQAGDSEPLITIKVGSQ
ncbi:protein DETOXIFICATION 52-like [Aristolochia californica]|uniref:protein DETOXIFICATION 52-like n=1 Tax=Aristolochia californica TaxID=171875 RepID=UPI0035DA39C6